METKCALEDIARKLADGKMSSRQLASLDFEADGRDISIRIRSTSHPLWYPPLGLIFERIGSTCADRGVSLSQLRRITFGENEICVELHDSAAGATLAFPIRGTLGLPASSVTAAAIDAAGTPNDVHRAFDPPS
jgi:hypothetical protein